MEIQKEYFFKCIWGNRNKEQVVQGEEMDMEVITEEEMEAQIWKLKKQEKSKRG